MKKLTCHCNAIEVEINISGNLDKTLRCNCSLCKRKGAIMSMVKNEDFKIIKGKDKLKLLDKFEDERLWSFGKKIIYQEAPDVLPKEIYRKIKSEIARRILSENKEKWWTVKECFFEIDNLRNKYSDENDDEKMKFLDQLNDFVMSIQQKYENA